MHKRSWVVLLCLVGCGIDGDAGLHLPAPLVPPARSLGVKRQAVTRGDGPNGAHILFLNFDGATVTPPASGEDNSAANESWIATRTTTLPPFDAKPYGPALSRDAAISAIVNHFKRMYGAYNVQVVTERPTSGRYTMCIVGGTPGPLLGSQA